MVTHIHIYALVFASSWSYKNTKCQSVVMIL